MIRGILLVAVGLGAWYLLHPSSLKAAQALGGEVLQIVVGLVVVLLVFKFVFSKIF